MVNWNDFQKYVDSQALFLPHEQILLAVSGGKDSVLMAHLFSKSGYSFAIAHCNFQLRGSESDRDEAFVRELALKLKVPFYLQKFNTKSYAEKHQVSTQMAARDLRYAWFQQLSQEENYSYIALAQHQNDAIETLLWNLIRGTGIAGLHGIMPKRANLIRPLMYLTANEISNIVKNENIAFVEDSSNAKTDYSRNLLRHEVVPVLKRLNPNLEQSFQSNISRFSDLEHFLNLQVEAIRKDFFAQDEQGQIFFKKDVALALNPTTLLLYELLKPFGFSGAVIEEIIEALKNSLSGKFFESNAYKICLDRELVYIIPKSSEDVNMDDKFVVEGDNEFGIGCLTFHQVPGGMENLVNDAMPLFKVHLDADKIEFPLRLRYYQVGDRFKPLGMSGAKKLSDFFIGLKIPVHQKSNIPLLCDAKNRIVWVIPYRIDNQYKITKSTKKLAIFEWKIKYGK